MNLIEEKLIKHYESLHDGDLTMIGLQPKLDPAGIWTEGYGRAMRDAKGNFIRGTANKALAYKMQTIHTIEEANVALIEDLKPFELQVARKVTIPLSDAKRAAVVSHCYNTGGSSTLFNMINTNDPKLYDWWCGHYITADNIPMKGLVYRRKTEAVLFKTEILTFYN